MPGSVAKRSRELRRRIQYIFQNPDASLNPRARIGTILARPLECSSICERAAWQRDRKSQKHWRMCASMAAMRRASRISFRAVSDSAWRSRVRSLRSRSSCFATRSCLVSMSRCRPMCCHCCSGCGVSTIFPCCSFRTTLRWSEAWPTGSACCFAVELMEVGDVEDIFSPPFHPYTYELLMAVPSINRLRQPRDRPRSGGVAAAPWDASSPGVASGNSARSANENPHHGAM